MRMISCYSSPSMELVCVLEADASGQFVNRLYPELFCAV